MEEMIMDIVDFEEPKSRVYILIGDKNRLIRIEGEYTLPSDLTDWVLVDEGYGDRFNLAQTYYLDNGIIDEEGLHNYYFIKGAIKDATEAQKAEERSELPIPGPTEMEELSAQVLYTALMTDALIGDDI